MRSDSHWTTDFFAAAARDWTPASVCNAARVLYAPLSCDPEASRRCASVLSDGERQRADRFVTEEGKAHFQQRRAFRQYCGALALGAPRSLSRVVFEETAKGRPYLPGLPGCWLSFSSCPSGFVGAWSSTHAIGVDLEDRTRNLEAAELARCYFSRPEAEAVERAEGATRQRIFLQLWSLKEAALKSIGEGLPFGLAAFEFALAPDPRAVRAPGDYGGPDRFHAHLIEDAGNCAAIVLREGCPSLQHL